MSHYHNRYSKISQNINLSTKMYLHIQNRSLWILCSQGRFWVHHLSLSSGRHQNGDWQWLPLPITISAVAKLVFHCLFMHANEWQEKSHHWNSDQQWSPPPIAILAVVWTQAQVVNSNCISTGKETPEVCQHQQHTIVRWAHQEESISNMLKVLRMRIGHNFIKTEMEEKCRTCWRWEKFFILRFIFGLCCNLFDEKRNLDSSTIDWC